MKGSILAKLMGLTTLCDFDDAFEKAEGGFNMVLGVTVTISIIIGIIILAVVIGVIVSVVKNRKKISDATQKLGKAVTNKLEGLFEEKKDEGMAVCSQCGAKVETINGKGTCPYCGGKVITK